MKNIIIITHSVLASGILSSMKMIVGECDSVKTVCFENGWSINKLKYETESKIKEFTDKKEEFILVVDMFGASPFNTSFELALKYNALVVSGASLPLLLALYLEKEDYSKVKVETIVNTVKEQLTVTSPCEIISNLK